MEEGLEKSSRPKRDRRWRREAGPILILLLLTGGIHAWLIYDTELPARDGVGFMRYAWRLQHEPWGDVLRTSHQHPGYPLTIAAVWQMSGFCMAMFLAGLRGIPEELREAARVDGASEFQAFRYMVFPLLRPITLSAVIILGHISLKIFDLVFVMTFGGPGYATDMPGLNMFITTFRQDLFARGAAIATVLLLMVAVLIVPYLVWNLRGETEQ